MDCYLACDRESLPETAEKLESPNAEAKIVLRGNFRFFLQIPNWTTMNRSTFGQHFSTGDIIISSFLNYHQKQNSQCSYAVLRNSSSIKSSSNHQLYISVCLHVQQIKKQMLPLWSETAMKGRCFGERLGIGIVTKDFYVFGRFIHLVETLCHWQIFYWFLVRQ